MITSFAAILGGLFTGAILKKLGFKKAGLWIGYVTLKFWWVYTALPIILFLGYIGIVAFWAWLQTQHNYTGLYQGLEAVGAIIGLFVLAAFMVLLRALYNYLNYEVHHKNTWYNPWKEVWYYRDGRYTKHGVMYNKDGTRVK